MKYLGEPGGGGGLPSLPLCFVSEQPWGGPLNQNGEVEESTPPLHSVASKRIALSILYLFHMNFRKFYFDFQKAQMHQPTAISYDQKSTGREGRVPA